MHYCSSHTLVFPRPKTRCIFIHFQILVILSTVYFVISFCVYFLYLFYFNFYEIVSFLHLWSSIYSIILYLFFFLSISSSVCNFLDCPLDTCPLTFFDSCSEVTLDVSDWRYTTTLEKMQNGNNTICQTPFKIMWNIVSSIYISNLFKSRIHDVKHKISIYRITKRSYCVFRERMREEGGVVRSIAGTLRDITRRARTQVYKEESGQEREYAPGRRTYVPARYTREWPANLRASYRETACARSRSSARPSNRPTGCAHLCKVAAREVRRRRRRRAVLRVNHERERVRRPSVRLHRNVTYRRVSSV